LFEKLGKFYLSEAVFCPSPTTGTKTHKNLENKGDCSGSGCSSVGESVGNPYVDGSKPQYGSVALTTACFLPLCSRCVCGAIERKTPDHYWIGGPVNVPPAIGLVPGLTTGYMGVMRAQRAALFRIASSSQPVKPGHNSGTPPMPTYGAEMHPVQYTGSEEIYYRCYSRICG
jgi:hypothetical protein